MFKKILFVTMIAASLGGAATSVAADVYINVAPPPLRVETEPAPRPGYIYTPGIGHGVMVIMSGYRVHGCMNVVAIATLDQSGLIITMVAGI